MEQTTLKSYLKRLTILLEAQVVNSHAPERDSPPAKETIYNGAVADTVDSAVIVDDENEASEDGERYIFVVWKQSVFLARPRMRLQAPSVVFSSTATLKPEADPSGRRKHEYLDNGVPSGLNLLESFGSDPALNGIKPRLSALRVSRVAPVTQSKDMYRALKGLTHLTLIIYPVVHTRVRFTRPNVAPPSPAIIAHLEVDFTPFFECEIVLEKIDLGILDGVAEDLNLVQGLSLPLSCVAHDHVTFLYRLSPQESDVAPKNLARDLDINISCTALVRPGECTPALRMAWTTTLDFTLPVNPGFGTAVTQPIQRAHRPSQLSIGDGASLIAPSVSRPDALPSLEAAAARSTETTIPDFGITMTFTAPEGPIYAGDEFTWTVFVVNRTSQQVAPNRPADAQPAARKLALLAIPRRRRNEVRVVRPPSTSGHVKRKSVTNAAAPASGGGGGQQQQQQAVADAVLDENVVHAMQRSSLVDSTDVVCLSADTRVGPLAPSACHVVELRFVALHEGIVGVECIRVVDLGSQEHVDVRELPIMVVEKRRDERPIAPRAASGSRSRASSVQIEERRTRSISRSSSVRVM